MEKDIQSYSSPEVKVYEVKVQKIICESTNDTPRLINDEGEYGF